MKKLEIVNAVEDILSAAHKYKFTRNDKSRIFLMNVKSNIKPSSIYVDECRKYREAPKPKSRSSTRRPYDMKRRWYVYEIQNPLLSGKRWGRKYQPIYYGVGHVKENTSPHKRAYFHIKKENYEQQKTRKQKKIAKCISQGMMPIINIVLKRVTEKQAKTVEIQLIYVVGRFDIVDQSGKHQGPLTNKSQGGDGASNVTYSEKQNQLKAERTRQWHQNMTIEEKRARSDKISKSVKKAVRLMSKLKKEKINNKRTATISKLWKLRLLSDLPKWQKWREKFSINVSKARNNYFTYLPKTKLLERNQKISKSVFNTIKSRSEKDWKRWKRNQRIGRENRTEEQYKRTCYNKSIASYKREEAKRKVRKI